MDSFKAFIDKYENNLGKEETISLLCDNKIRECIIKNDDGCFLAQIAGSPSDKLRDFYFNEQTIPIYVELGKLSTIVCRGHFYPNKIKLFDNKVFLSNLSSNNLTEALVVNIVQEMEPPIGLYDHQRWDKFQKDNPQLKDVLKSNLLKYLRYLQEDFDNNINDICIFMKKISDEWYEEFLGIILNDLKAFAKENKEFEFDTLFDNYYINYGDYADYNKIESIIKEFEGIDNLYYSPILIKSLIEKSTKPISHKILISKEQLNWLHDYIFNSHAKEPLLKKTNQLMFENLYLCYSNEFINFFCDDESLNILDNNKRFDRNLFYYIPHDSLTNSNLFAKLLIKNYPTSSEYDSTIAKLSKSFKDDDSISNLLDKNLENKDYNYFYRIFKGLSSNDQLKYLKNNFEKLLNINNIDLFKGMKKEAYELFKDKVDIPKWIFPALDLSKMLENKNDYSQEQFEIIFSNSENIKTILNSLYLEEMYKNLLNLNILSLNELYMSDEFVSKLRNTNKLNRIFSIVEDIKVDIRKLMLNKETLIDIGEETLKEYDWSLIFKNNNYPELETDYRWYYFLSCAHNLEDKSLLFDILDFYLNNERYLSTFYILRQSLKEKDLNEYLTSRKDLITKIIKENKSKNNKFILGNLPKKYLPREFSKERENIILYCTLKDFHNIFSSGPKDYTISDTILNSEPFNEKFDGYYYVKKWDDEYYQEIEKEIYFATHDEKKAKEIVLKLRQYQELRKKIIEDLNEMNDLKPYLKVLMNSQINVYDLEFTKDMIDVLIFNRRIEEVSSKYNNENLEEIKLNILNKVIMNSKESIASSITNPLTKKAVPTEYRLGGKTIVIPTITYDGDPYTFFVRRMRTGKHINTERHKEKIECYSTITEKNRSVYLGDSGVICGYIGIKPENIVHVNSIDAISNDSAENNYKKARLKYPEWVSMKELNSRTLWQGSYNEIRVKGIYIPEYNVSYDEPNEMTLNCTHQLQRPLVLIKRKAYPNAIENCADIYEHWK